MSNSLKICISTVRMYWGGGTEVASYPGHAKKTLFFPAWPGYEARTEVALPSPPHSSFYRENRNFSDAYLKVASSPGNSPPTAWPGNEVSLKGEYVTAFKFEI